MKLYDKHFLHTLDVWNCTIMIFVVWRSTRDNRILLVPELFIYDLLKFYLGFVNILLSNQLLNEFFIVYFHFTSQVSAS